MSPVIQKEEKKSDSRKKDEKNRPYKKAKKRKKICQKKSPIPLKRWEKK